ncbi:MAG: RNA polymerase sigma factor [Kofleriaceae bacterium]|nr:RNA polymerase sigma factor [Kofleriaceae bacterium]
MASEAPPGGPDLALVEALRAGDERAFLDAVRRLDPMLRRLARTFVRTAAQADEVIQDTWVGVLRGLDAFEGRSSFRTWVCRILMNRARTTARRDARLVPMSSLGDGDDGPDLDDHFTAEGAWAIPPATWPDDDPARLIERRQLRAVIDQALETLPPRQRQVVVLRDLDGWSSEEVCNALDLTETNQRVLLHRARARLRASLEIALTHPEAPTP